jgi:hypothetical protein
MTNPELHCRVCGLEQAEAPWGPDESTPTWAYCDCCGAEFGYQDCSPAAARKNRTAWVAKGARWSTPEKQPADWVLEVQLEQIPKMFR